MLHLSEFVWRLRSSVLVVFNNFLLIDTTDRSKISGDQKRFFIALILYPLSFFVNTPFKVCDSSENLSEEANTTMWDLNFFYQQCFVFDHARHLKAY